ncbi:hypothetical protein VITU102760_24280 [Vibrio tubiashii]|uniref:Uncharacterized protein n=1 Tax=Vibrio tubiashii ATCC 19109 TaxID=1051646 RepID=A0A0A0ST52_9VIBR|nr:hypothetical protein [Vibrio tubiashii]AIW17454.1 hypothetical protein IX91_25695 [Vibrio tubiashii ATCC 19109]EIF04420.1 hypothetical protein VT1337_08636 [Vibrio tubiashii NCIMB 1337 = ATCC 19106]
MTNKSDKRRYFPVGDVERVEYPCQKCNQGFYRYNVNGERIEKHNQMQHNCTHCNAVTFFTIRAVKPNGTVLYVKH